MKFDCKGEFYTYQKKEYGPGVVEVPQEVHEALTAAQKRIFGKESSAARERQAAGASEVLGGENDARVEELMSETKRSLLEMADEMGVDVDPKASKQDIARSIAEYEAENEDDTGDVTGDDDEAPSTEEEDEE